MSTENKKELKIPLTIEKQLENYCKRDGHNERHEKLWHAWYQNKNWIKQLLQVSLFSFPTYSKHDESHAASVLNNIEMILGQERIAELSATDCFVLLHTVYIHDLGMCMLKKDRREIIENKDFIDMVDRLEKDGDETVRKAIKVLKRTDYQNVNGEEYIESMKLLYQAKLEVYYAIIELLADFRRSEHAEKSAETLYEWTMEPSKLGSGFSMSGVPLRIFLATARCAQMHTNDRFEDILKLPRKDGGYASDYYHPRFIAVLLMLGDLLDMDNNRFHPMVMEFVEDFPETSLNHYEKHHAIRRLSISPDIIEIEADCQNQNSLRLVRKECDMLKEILQQAGYLWGAICPENFKGTLPYLGETQLYLSGKKIPENLVTTQFHITQKKAFAILEGSNFYEGRFVFLREFLQNAIDATKMQYFYDYCGTAAYYYGDKNLKNKSPIEMNNNLPLSNYPIEIGMKMQKKSTDGTIGDVTAEEISKNAFTDEEYGVLVSVKDFGTGIDQERISAISKVGNSKEKDKAVIQEMPSWLQPTAEFGVGLQSAFVLTDSFKCYTHTRSEECYEITFSSGASSRHEGYINVAPVESISQKYRSYGTCFEVYVPLDKKFLHSESVCTWSGRDPFSDDYDASRPARHAAEMISQMVLYLDRMLGELLFPVSLDIQHRNELNLALDTRNETKIKKMCDGVKKPEDLNNSWIFKAKENNSECYSCDTEEFTCVLEYETSRLHVWDKSIETFCTVSGIHLLEGEQENRRIRNKGLKRRGASIYYKGIELERRCMEEEIEIFEFIDMKASLERKYINISRRGFTSQGESYFENVIYKKLLETVKKALKQINNQKCLDPLVESAKNNLCDLVAIKKNESAEWTEEDKYYEKLQKFAGQIVSLAFLSHLAIRDYRDELFYLGLSCGQKTECLWQSAVVQVADYYNEIKEIRNKSVKEDLKKLSLLFNIKCYKVGKLRYNVEVINILDIFRSDRHYAVYQVRENPYVNWIAYLIEIDEGSYARFYDRLYVENKIEHAALGGDESIKKSIENVETLENEINDEFENIMEIATNTIRRVEAKNVAELQFLLAWLERNLPAIALFSRTGGNERINVLSHYYMPYIYTNKEHKKLIIGRILENVRDNNIKRFSTYAWQGRQYLGVDRLPFSCYFVKRGYFNRAYLKRVIFPLDGNVLKKISEKMEREEETEFVQNVKQLVEYLDMRSYLGRIMQENGDTDLSDEEQRLAQRISIVGILYKSVTSLSLGICEFYDDIMSSFMNEENAIEIDQDYFLKLLAKRVEWNDALLRLANLYLDILETGGNGKEEIDEFKKDSIVKFMGSGWHFIHSGEWKRDDGYLSIKPLIEDYKKQCTANPILINARKQMYGYIDGHKLYPLKKERIESCFKKFEDEILDLLLEIEKEKIEKVIQKLIKD